MASVARPPKAAALTKFVEQNRAPPKAATDSEGSVASSVDSGTQTPKQKSRFSMHLSPLASSGDSGVTSVESENRWRDTDSPFTTARKRMSARLSKLTISNKATGEDETAGGGGGGDDDDYAKASPDAKPFTSAKFMSPKRMFGKGGLKKRNSIEQGDKDLDTESGVTRISRYGGHSHHVDVAALPIKVAANETVKLDVTFAECTTVTHICDGSNSNLFKAEFDSTPVIVKRLKIDRINKANVLDEFEFESEFLRRSSHCPHLVRIYASGMDKVSEFDLPSDVPFDANSQLASVTETGERVVQVPFVIIERLNGGTLSFFLAKPRSYHARPFTLLRTFEIWKELATALDFLHNQFHSDCCVIHRDLKPDNICFDDQDRLRLIDFGLSICINKAKSADDVYSMTGCTGSLRYMSPEVAASKPYNDRADIYSFGIIAYEVLTGVAPFGSMDRAKFMKRVVEARERPGLGQDDYGRTVRAPQRAKALIARCWHWDLTKRPSASELLTEATQLFEEEQVRVSKGGLCQCS